MKNVCYSLILPAVHLLLAIILIYPEQRESWKYIPLAQAVQDQERAHPQTSESTSKEWNPCYEHHASRGQRLLYSVEFPTGMLIGPDGTSDGCSAGAMTPLLHKLGDQMRIKTGWIFTDFLLAGSIWVQWYLVGVWQFLEKRKRLSRKWEVPVALLTACGLLMTIYNLFHYSQLQDLIIALASLVAFICWAVLLVMFLIKGIAETGDRLQHKRNYASMNYCVTH